MYFNNFPKTYYIYYDQDESSKEKIAVNITTRLRIVDYVKRYKSNFDRYVIKDGERPDTLAHKLYDRADLHWIFFLANDMLNPYLSWPMSQSDLTRYIDEKYEGSSFYVPDIWKQRRESGADTFEYKVLDGFDLKDVTLSKILNDFEDITVLGSDLLKLSVGSSVKVVVDGVLFETTVLAINSDFYEVALESKSWTTNFSTSGQNYFLYQIDNFGQKRCIRVPITRLINERRYAVCEFNYNGEYRDPGQLFSSGASLYSTNPYAHFVHPPTSENINDGNFLNSTLSGDTYDSFADAYAIKNTDGLYLDPSYYKTNEYLELELNEEKRKILVPKPSLVASILKSFKEIFRDNLGRA